MDRRATEAADAAPPRAMRLFTADRAVARSPVAVWAAAQAAGRRAALLGSGAGAGDAAGTFSFVAIDPAARLVFEPDDPGDPFDALRAALGRVTWRGPERPPVPFCGGWIGFFSYDLLHRIERVPRLARRDHGFPLIDLRFYPRVLAYDHARHLWTACVLDGADDAAVAEGEGKGGPRAARALLEWLDAPEPPRSGGPALAGPLASNFTRPAYEAAVGRVLDYIAAGDVYQVNLAQRFAGRRAADPVELARRLFDASPAPFSAFLQEGDRTIVSSSPERFLRVRDGTVETWPIKGTRPRGRTPAEDARLRAELLDSAKERAELTMITDLLRNDLGRVCRYGSVQVPEPRVLESFEQVHHTRSTVTGRLREGLDGVDLLRATLPGGSVTGAPKIRATEIIEELEPTARGPYCGAIGYLGIDGAMDLNIAIRTLLVEGDRLSFQVGGGIVADSRPDLEYEETLHKAQGLLKALGAV